MIKKSYDLIIFDCDGTLVDSEYLHNKVIADQMAALGLPQYDVAYNLRHFAGKGMEAVLAAVEADTGRALPASFMPDYIANVDARMPELLKTIEGVRETVEYCRDRAKICIGSNGERENIMRMVDAAQLSGFFPPSIVFTKSMVVHPKPAPDLFLLAAKTMGAEPARTLVIEDSVTGATAGKAAGMTVIGFTGTFHDRPAQAAALKACGVDYITDKFPDIIPFLDAGIIG